MFRQGGGVVAIAGAIQIVVSVIKLGGSLLKAQVLSACLDAAERRAGNVLIVPGGGVFADQVRAAQSDWGFDDRAAHRMAILAMQQMALVFKSLKPEFALLHSISDLPISAKAVIWSPNPDELDAAGIVAGWDVTSDSLAAWLAARVNAHELLLVKSCAVAEQASLSELQRQGVIDAGFLSFTEKAAFKTRVVNKDLFCQ
ncbi:amino acid kinase family protein [Methylomonas sp. MgM2]